MTGSGRMRDAADWLLRETSDVALAHAVDIDHGLHDDEAARRAGSHGPNEQAEGRRPGPWRLCRHGP